MGGAKKLSLARAEKQQGMQTDKQEKNPASTKSKTPARAEKKVGSIDLPDLKENELLSELLKMKAITPYQVASKYSIKLGVAKNLLSQMEQRGYIKMISRNGNLKIYKALAA